MKHFICTHTFHSEETKKAYFEDNKDITSKEWFASVEGEKVKCIQHWLGDQDFWFCHWIAESENQIHEKLEAIGADKLFLTMAQEMNVYATSSSPNITDTATTPVSFGHLPQLHLPTSIGSKSDLTDTLPQ